MRSVNARPKWSFSGIKGQINGSWRTHRLQARRAPCLNLGKPRRGLARNRRRWWRRHTVAPRPVGAGVQPYHGCVRYYGGSVWIGGLFALVRGLVRGGGIGRREPPKQKLKRLHVLCSRIGFGKGHRVKPSHLGFGGSDKHAPRRGLCAAGLAGRTVYNGQIVGVQVGVQVAHAA
jgi:hypothetical protein